MKKSTIWTLAILMGLTFMGLLYVQILYMKNMIRMREDQFREGVTSSLSAVANMLERDEARYFLVEDASNMSTGMVFTQTKGALPSQTGLVYSFKSSSGVEADIKISGDPDKINQIQFAQNDLKRDHYKALKEKIKGQYLYQKGLIDEVILNILNQASDRPIRERADSVVVESYLKSELKNNGMELPVEFAIVNRYGHEVYKTSGYVFDIEDKSAFGTQTLFQSDPESKRYNLNVYFPTKDDYIFSSVKFMIPSFAFTIILLIIFIFTIIVVFRQKKLTEMKNDFINNMTHEFKTPISSISLAAQMLNDSSVRKSPSMLQHISTVITDETKRLRFQVEKVLQMSMFERQKATLKQQEVDANAAIDNIVNTFKLKVEKYGGQIEAKLDAEDPIVNVDEMHFTNVIFNLLDNAVKYRKEDEPLKLVVSSRNRPNSKLEISIADNGIGIKKENHKRIFEKFYRVSTGNRHDVKGFGLGLAYVYKMVHELGGEIQVDSELNIGTKFIITLPLITKN